LNRIAAAQLGLHPAENSADGVFTEAQLYLALRDFAGAVQLLDAYLNDLPHLSPAQFAQPYQPATIVRLMAMRAQLAARAGDHATARRWSRAVVDLWQDGDDALTPFLDQMRTLARS
jgi:hypothetical protein